MRVNVANKTVRHRVSRGAERKERRGAALRSPPLPAHRTGRADFPHPASTGFTAICSERRTLRHELQLARKASGTTRCLTGLRQVTHRRLLQQAHRSRPFPPPAFPSFSGGHIRLSRLPPSRCPTAPMRPLPSPSTGLPRIRDPLSRRAVPITLVDRSGRICRLLPQIVLPSPNSGRVGVHNFPFEACSGFTRITARRFAPPPKAAFVAGLRYRRLPDRTACQLPGQPTIARVGLAPTR